MTGSKPDEFIRTPMQWTGGSNAGFSTAKPWQAVNADYKEFNVADEEADPDSLLNLYKDIIKLRNEHIALRTGDYLPFETNCLQLYPILRVENGEVILSIINIGRRQMENCTISIGASPLNGTYESALLYGEGELGSMTFNPDGSVENYLIPFNFEPGQMAVFELSAK
jgi:alpha-amylase